MNYAAPYSFSRLLTHTPQLNDTIAGKGQGDEHRQSSAGIPANSSQCLPATTPDRSVQFSFAVFVAVTPPHLCLLSHAQHSLPAASSFPQPLLLITLAWLECLPLSLPLSSLFLPPSLGGGFFQRFGKSENLLECLVDSIYHQHRPVCTCVC